MFSVKALDAASLSFLPCEVSECFEDLVFSEMGLLALRFDFCLTCETSELPLQLTYGKARYRLNP